MPVSSPYNPDLNLTPNPPPNLDFPPSPAQTAFPRNPKSQPSETATSPPDALSKPPTRSDYSVKRKILLRLQQTKT